MFAFATVMVFFICVYFTAEWVVDTAETEADDYGSEWEVK